MIGLQGMPEHVPEGLLIQPSGPTFDASPMLYGRQSAVRPSGAVPTHPICNIVQPTRSRLHLNDQSGKSAL